jgi:RNA polymerase sigma-70 factor (ECF subfamily)
MVSAEAPLRSRGDEPRASGQPWLAASYAGPRAPREVAFDRDPEPFTGARPIVPAGTVGSRVDARTSTDAELIDALQRGEDWAATALYDRVQGPVVRTLARLLRQRQSAELEDLTQTTFERMIRFLTQRSLGGSCNLPGWSRAVATNVAIDFLRREVSERRLFVPSESCVEELRATDAPAEASLDSRTSLRRVQTIIAAMSPKYAETVVLHDVLGHDLAEIAEMMGATVAATQSRLVRGRKDLLRRAQREKKR